MLALLLTVAAVPQSTLQLCKPALARKAGGEIDRITVNSRTASGATKVIRGQMTVFIGMASAPAGSASTHHLIRSDYHFGCWVRRGRIIRTSLTQP